MRTRSAYVRDFTVCSVAKTATFLRPSSITFSAPGIVTQRTFLSGNISVCIFRSVHAEAVLQAKITRVAPASKSFCTPVMVRVWISSGDFSQKGQCS